MLVVSESLPAAVAMTELFGILLTVRPSRAEEVQMKLRMRRWLLGLAMLFVLAGAYAPPQADAQVVVVVGHHHHRHYHHRHYRR